LLRVPPNTVNQGRLVGLWKKPDYERLASERISQGDGVIRESAAVKGRRYFVEARLRLREVDEDAGIVAGQVRGDSGVIYQISFDGERGWSCSCPSRGGRCSHLAAARLVCVMEPRR
jgi:uncharacterized Zn finger protein